MRIFLIALTMAASLSAQVTYEDIKNGAGEDWLTYAGSYNGWRHSPLEQITPENAGSLVAKWVYHVPNANGLRTNPIVHEGVMYVTDANSVYALDARSGRLVWSYVDGRATKQMVNRGAAILGDNIYLVTSDNYLTALDRQSGSVIFSKQYALVEDGVGSTAAPLAVKDMIIVGSAGGDSGMRGFIAALSAKDGHELWRTYTIPKPGEPGSESWGNPDVMEWGGAAAWLSGTYDPELNLLYWTTGNAWPDYNGDVRPGDNLFTSSLVALDLETGKMKWYFQFTPHDTHDWDAQSWPMLLDLEFEGKPRKLVVHANRNGFFYILDRVTGEFLKATQLTDSVDWATGIDAKGRPILVPDKDPTPEGNWVCPSVKGATNWMGQTFHPDEGLLYLLTLEQCGWFYLSGQEPEPMKNFSGGGATEEGGQVVLRAIDPATGERAWEYPMTGFGRMWTGAVSTKTGVLITGDDDGRLIALNAKTGQYLWDFNMGELSTASPVIYEVDGKQRIAIASATAIFSFGLFEKAEPLEAPKITKRK